jgi:hypothetical protein
MHRTFRVLIGALVCVGLAYTAFAQNPTGSITGRITYDNAGLPGVTILAESDASQGTKTAVSSESGDFKLPFLAPGVYKLTFSLSGFKTQSTHVKVSAAQTRTVDVVMYDESFSEEIEVTSAYETISSSIQASTTYEQSMIEKLPISRTMSQAIWLSPGVSDNGPGLSGISISGAQSYENLLLVNGVVINENIRGQVLGLYIEDAVQETTTSTSGVSAEYGRFQGGVINMITKSGGNEFSGSFRMNLTNESWESKNNEFEGEQTDAISRVAEATLGGYVLKDKLWFFLAGRDTSTKSTRQTNYTNWDYPYTTEQTRYEAKLTFSITDSHRVLGSYLERESASTNTDFGTIYDFASLNPNRTDPQDLWTINYTGVFTENFFVEAQISERFYGIANGTGGPVWGIPQGVLLRDTSRSGWPRYHTPTFCGDPEYCQDEERNNENQLIKGSIFFSSDTQGSHDLVFGFDRFNDIRIQDNHQQASRFRIYGTDAIIIGNDIYPVIEPWLPGASWGSWYVWTPIFEDPRASEFYTNSLFLNDTWRFNENWTFNIGLRYDMNDGTDSSGTKVADDAKLSPRFGATYDVFADGDLLIRASYGHYVTGITQGVANDAGAGGSPAWVEADYLGPCINCGFDENTDPSLLTTQDEAIMIWYDWFLDNGGEDSIPGVYYWDLPGFTPQIRQSLISPHTIEYSIGVTKRLGNRGIVRADYVHRDGEDFYTTRRDMSTGQVDALGAGFLDLALIENNNSLYERVYDGLHTQIQYRFGDSWNVGANWTWAHARGNFDGEAGNTGPLTGGLTEYPEYKDPSWSAPYGNIGVDERTKVRAWVVWDAISSARNNLSVSLLQNYWSGENYSLTKSVNVSNYIDNPGYLYPPTTATYYFSGRGEYQWDDVSRTDISLNYSFFLTLGGVELEMFIQPEILNVFNESAQVDGNTSISTSGDDPFNPWTETPVEGTHWHKSSSFGEASGDSDFQAAREFRFSLGLRF